MAKRPNWSSRRRKSAGLTQLPTRGARGNIPFARVAVALVLGGGEILLRDFMLKGGVWILGLKFLKKVKVVHFIFR